jgi:L-lactate dehydrogenase complex protein LldG
MKRTPKDVILARIHKAIANAPEPLPIPHDFREGDERDRTAILEDFIDRLVDYKAIVTSTDDAGLPQAIADACQQQGLIRLVVPADVPARWIPQQCDVAARRAAALPR